MEELIEPPANEVFIAFTHVSLFKLAGRILVHTSYVFRAVRFDTPIRAAPWSPKGPDRPSPTVRDPRSRLKHRHGRFPPPSRQDDSHELNPRPCQEERLDTFKLVLGDDFQTFELLENKSHVSFSLPAAGRIHPIRFGVQTPVGFTGDPEEPRLQLAE